MNGSENLKMTGSSNPCAEQLNWLSEVASAVSKGALNRNNSQNQNDKPVALNSNLNVVGSHSSPMILTNSSTPFTPSVVLTQNPESSKVKMFATPLQMERTRQVHSVSTPAIGSGTTLYYSQAPRTTPYSNFFQATYSSPMPFPAAASQTAVTNPSIGHPNSQRSYLQIENYPSLVSVQTINPSHGQVQNSSGYLQHSKLPSSPTNISLPSTVSPGRFFQQGRSILISRSPDGVLVHSAQERDHIQIQLSPIIPQVLEEALQRKSYTSTESILGSSSCSPITDNIQNSVQTIDFSVLKDQVSNQNSTSPSYVGYKLPTGKEGSLKHRILRPPSINIVDPPQSLISDAPLSAPPIRSFGEISPKQARSVPSSGYRSFSSSASSLTEASNRVASSGVSPNGNFTNHCSSLSSGSPSPAPSTSPTTALKYPQSFMKGAIIQLANNQLKTVESMTTDDFIECGILSPTLKIDSSTVVSIDKIPSCGAAKLGFQVGQDNIQITVEAPLEHPFFVYKQGWSSCSPERSAQRYGLTCHKLKVGDTCISLTNKLQDSEQKTNANSCDINSNSFDKNQNKLPGKTKDSNSKSQMLALSVSTCLADKKCDKLTEKSSSNLDQSFSSSRKRKRRWSAPDNLSPGEDGSSS